MKFKKLNYYCSILFLFLLGAVLLSKISFWILVLPVLLWLGIVGLSSINIKWNFFLSSVRQGNPNGREIAITFDDGPHPIYTEQVLRILDKYNAKATFFCIGKNVASHPEIVRKISMLGHTVANHSFTHSPLIDFKNKFAWIDELQKTDLEIEKAIGKKPQFFRPPFGVTTPHLAKALDVTGHKSIAWSARSYDTVISSIDIIDNKLQAKIKPGAIILLHDRHNRITLLLEQLLPKLAKKNFTFVTLNALIDEKPYCEA